MTLEARRTDDLASHDQLPPLGQPLAAEVRTVRIMAGGDAAVPDIPRGSWQRVFPLQQERQLTRARHREAVAEAHAALERFILAATGAHGPGSTGTRGLTPTFGVARRIRAVGSDPLRQGRQREC